MTLFVLLVLQTVLTAVGFVLAVKNYKQVGQDYQYGSGDNEDTETVDETYDLENENDADLQEGLIDGDGKSKAGKAQKKGEKQSYVYGIQHGDEDDSLDVSRAIEEDSEKAAPKKKKK